MDRWIADLLERMGYAGVALLMFAEHVVPPIPSELIMPLAGYTAARGSMRLWLVILMGSLGSVFGTLPWYLAGRWLGSEGLRRWAGQHGRWLTMSPGDVDRALASFDRHREQAVLVGRLLPAVRTLISAPAGVAKMSPGRFLLYSSIGSALWSGTLAAAGYQLGARYERVTSYVGPVSNAAIGAALLIYLWRVARWKPGRAA